MSMKHILCGLLAVGAACLALPAAHAITFDVSLDTAQEVPTPNVAGFSPSGTATVDVTIADGSFTVAGNYSGMTSNVTGSHLHGLAGPGSTAGVIQGLANDGGTSGTFSGGGTLSAANLAGLLAGNTYLNIHTMDNGPGEIRGQVVDSDIVVFDVILTADQEVPTPDVAGFSPMGTATVVGDRSTGEVEIVGSYSGMTSNVTGSHLHGLADFGSTAGVLIGLSNDGGTSGNFSGSGTLSPSDFQGLLDGLTYLNIHTQNNGPGEIRGQVIPEPTSCVLLAVSLCSMAMRRKK
ncbi:MAG: CHRD domain-containing protein [Lacipirellulaceae bacterium]